MVFQCSELLEKDFRLSSSGTCASICMVTTDEIVETSTVATFALSRCGMVFMVARRPGAAFIRVVCLEEVPWNSLLCRTAVAINGFGVIIRGRLKQYGFNSRHDWEGKLIHLSLRNVRVDCRFVTHLLGYRGIL